MQFFSHKFTILFHSRRSAALCLHFKYISCGQTSVTTERTTETKNFPTPTTKDTGKKTCAGGKYKINKRYVESIKIFLSFLFRANSKGFFHLNPNSEFVFRLQFYSQFRELDAAMHIYTRPKPREFNNQGKSAFSIVCCNEVTHSYCEKIVFIIAR